MQHAVAEHDVVLLGLERGTEQVHLQEAHARQTWLERNASASPREFRQRSVPVTLRHVMPRKFDELPCPASDLEHVGVVRQLLAEQLGVEAASRLGDQRAQRFVIVIVRERMLLVERLDDLGDVSRGLVVRPEELMDPIRSRKASAARGAHGSLVARSELAAAGGTAPRRQKRGIDFAVGTAVAARLHVGGLPIFRSKAFSSTNASMSEDKNVR